MTLLSPLRGARRRPAQLDETGRPRTCPACGLRVEEDDHAVHVRRGAYHAACVLYRGRAERDRWTVGA
jgi:hypothetical protein